MQRVRRGACAFFFLCVCVCVCVLWGEAERKEGATLCEGESVASCVREVAVVSEMQLC